VKTTKVFIQTTQKSKMTQKQVVALLREWLPLEARNIWLSAQATSL
jgi:hypothetical protein